MKPETKDKLFEAWAYCDMKDKSTEFMLSYMSDFVPSWDDSDVCDWIQKNSSKRTDWYNKNPDWYKKYNVD